MLERGMTCEHCGHEMLADWDCIPHHLTELTEDNVDDVMISMNPENIKLMHLRCHNKVHERFGTYQRHVYLVWGSPMAGKSTFVVDNCNPDDLIVDIDLIWECICKSGHGKPNRLKSNVFQLRDALMDQVRTRLGGWRNAYIIGTYPVPGERERLVKLYGAEELHIDTDKDTCLSRCSDPEWEKYIFEFWDRMPG
jgi:tetrahydromethanopterin S-methyltransferase subunit B